MTKRAIPLQSQAEESDSGQNLLALLHSATLPDELSAQELYRAACIGALKLLEERADLDALYNAALHSAAEEMRERALSALETMALADSSESQAQPALHKLYQSAVLDFCPPAQEFLRAHELEDEDPQFNSALSLLLRDKTRLVRTDPELRSLSTFFLQAQTPLRQRLLESAAGLLPHWALSATFWNQPNEQNRTALRKQYGSFSCPEKQLFCDTLTRDLPEQADLLAEIVLDQEDENARERCLKWDLLPPDEGQKALFFFLTEQWERYYESDADYRLIRQAYESHQDSLRSRLIEISRRSGNTAWLQQVEPAASLGQRGKGLNLSEWQIMIRLLESQSNWQRLWELLPTVPLCIMPEILQMLERASFQPQQADEQAFLKQLREQIERCGPGIPVPLAHRFFTQNSKITGVAAAGDCLAAAFLNGEIQLWNSADVRVPARSIYADGVSFRSLVISPDAAYLAAVCGDNSIRIFEVASGWMIKQLNLGHDPFNGLFIRADNRRLSAVNQKGRCFVRAFPNGAPIAEFDLGLPDCFRSSYDEETDRVVAMKMNGELSLFDLARRQQITRLKIDAGVMVSAPVCRGNLLSGIDLQNHYFCQNLISGRPLVTGVDCGYTERILQLLELPGGEIAVLGTQSGNIGITHVTDGIRLADIQQKDGQNAISGLQLDPNTRRLYTGSADGSLAAWDLNLFNWMTTSFALTELPGLKRIDDLCTEYPGKPVRNAVDWLKTIIQRRRRFDIEVDFD